MTLTPPAASLATAAAGNVMALLATRNAHKLAELRRALPTWELRAPDPGTAAAPEETGTTFLENALLKARWGRGLAGSGEWALGEDSGIEVDALGGRPGIESARWAEDGVARLLEELDGVANRRARYVCSLVACPPGGGELSVEGTLTGEIALAPRGDEGFGYDPIFVPDGETSTVAELGDAWKALHSHRARAGAALRQALAG
jgi:XTP/dITP diphosphohydrolase